MMGMLVLWSIICSVWGLGLGLVRWLDKPIWNINMKACGILLSVSAGNAFLIATKSKEPQIAIGMSVVAGCFLFACITDYKSFEVYQFTWWMAGAASIMMLFPVWEKARYILYVTLPEMLFFGLLQEFLFCRWYGRADCHAFVICALVSWGNGMGLKDWLIQMLIAFGILAIVQFSRQNINRKGNLKEPVAFLPFITVSFWINYGCFYPEKMIYWFRI